MRSSAIVIRLLAGLVCIGCSSTETVGRSRARMEHGVALGTRMRPTPLQCFGAGGRVVAAAGQFQIVTFATPYDCSSCTPHLDGVPEVVGKAGLSAHAFTTVWAPSMKAVERQVRHRARKQATCVDEDGSLWEEHNMLHTPFTVVLRDGVIVYLHDGNLQSAEEREQLAADLREIVAGE